MQNRNLLPEPPQKYIYDLRGQGDFRHKHNRTAPRFQTRGDGVEINLGFAACRHAEQQNGARLFLFEIFAQNAAGVRLSGREFGRNSSLFRSRRWCAIDNKFYRLHQILIPQSFQRCRRCLRFQEEFVHRHRVCCLLTPFNKSVQEALLLRTAPPDFQRIGSSTQHIRLDFLPYHFGALNDSLLRQYTFSEQNSIRRRKIRKVGGLFEQVQFRFAIKGVERFDEMRLRHGTADIRAAQTQINKPDDSFHLVDQNGRRDTPDRRQQIADIMLAHPLHKMELLVIDRNRIGDNSDDRLEFGAQRIIERKMPPCQDIAQNFAPMKRHMNAQAGRDPLRQGFGNAIGIGRLKVGSLDIHHDIGDFDQRVFFPKAIVIGRAVSHERNCFRHEKEK